jgi:hypothetical protein
MLYVEEFTRVTWDCVRFMTPKRAAGIRETLAASPLATFEICGTDLRTDKELFAAIASAMKFPDYFGMNWDALDECLRDLDAWIPAPGYVLIVRDATSLWEYAPKTAGNLVESWLFCAEDWSKEGKPFHLVFVW